MKPHDPTSTPASSGRHPEAVRPADTPSGTGSYPLLGLRVFDTRDFMGIDPVFGLNIANLDAGCQYAVSYRQMMLLVQIQRFLEDPEPSLGSDYRSYLLGYLAGLELGDPRQLVGYEHPAASHGHKRSENHSIRRGEYPGHAKSSSSESSFHGFGERMMDVAGERGNAPASIAGEPE